MAAKNQGININDITGAVFVTSQYRTSTQAKLNELTNLVKKILAYEVWKSAADAYFAGVPVGTLILVDDPKTEERDFKIEVVKVVRKKK